MAECPFYEREFKDEKSLIRHIGNTKYGHGNLKCNICKKQLSKCEDMNGFGQSKICSPPTGAAR